MTTGYSTLTKKEAHEDIATMRQATRRMAKSPSKARAFLIKAGFLTKSGKKLARQYR